MMSFFPIPYRDEILYSILARYHIRAGNLSYKTTMQEVFGSKTATAVLDLPCNIQNLINNMPPGSKLTAEEIINKHSLLPFYGAFLPPERANQIRSSMLGNRGGDIYSRAGIMAGGIVLNRFLKFCPKCAEEDLLKYGEMYWHRFHQIPCVICPKHGILLQDSSVMTAGFNKHQFTAANPINCEIKKEEGLSDIVIQHLLSLSLDIKYLLDSPLPNREIQWFKSQYIELLKEKVYANVNGKLYRRKLLKDFIDFYGSDFLEYVQSGININSNTNWLTDMLYNKVRTAHPIRHLLLIRFLETSIADVFCKKFNYTPFGSGPWACLNLAADHYLKPVIDKVEITYGSDNKEPIGTFYCNCGFVYTRSGYDEDDTAQYTYSKVKEFGRVWEEKLKKVVAMKLSLRETARLMGVDPCTVKKYVKKLELEIFWKEQKDCAKDGDIENKNIDRHPDDNKIEQYRDRWLLLQKEYPERGIKELRGIEGKIYSWLYRNDRQWLTQNSPEKRYVYINKRVDWKQRDQELLQKIRLLVQQMQTTDEKPKRISVSTIGSALGVRALLQKHFDKLPDTKDYIESVVETDSDFRLRRVQWAIKVLEKEGQEIKTWRILKKAGIRDEFAEEIRDLLI